MRKLASDRTFAGASFAGVRIDLSSAADLGRVLCLVIAAIFLLLPRPAAGEALYNQPVYDPLSGNYFELRKATPGYSGRGGVAAIGWAKARVLASKSVFQGVRGRLAIVKTKELNDFLRRTFKPDVGAWIGLRYWCEFNKLQWVTGEIHDRAAYANWARVWNHWGSKGVAQAQRTCSRRERFWPVHYWAASDDFRWNANGTGKEMQAFFIEYPTGDSVSSRP